MTDYTQNITFATKDALSTGDPAKVIKGSDIDGEFSEIETASATKLDKYAAVTELTALDDDADMLSVYDDDATAYKRITVANARAALGGVLKTVNVYEVGDSPATWTKPSDISYITVECVGGGGGGGGSSTTAGRAGASGGGGGYVFALIPASDLGATETATIGSGGSGGSSTASGSAGGTSSFTRTTGSNPQATGGSGGSVNGASWGTTGAQGGTGSNGDYAVVGGDSGASTAGSGECSSAAGGSSFMGGGSIGRVGNNGGNAGSLYGGGGAGGSNASGGGTGGGSGAAGVVIVKEYT